MTQETGAGAKGKGFIQVLGPGRMVDSHLKDPRPFLLKHPVLIGIGVLFFYPIIILAFGALIVRTSPCTILASGEGSPVLPVCGIRGIVGVGCGTDHQEAWRCCSSQSPPDPGHSTCTPRGAGWSLPGAPKSLSSFYLVHPSKVASWAQAHPASGCPACALAGCLC